jgi:hypothetical protein
VSAPEVSDRPDLDRARTEPEIGVARLPGAMDDIRFADGAAPASRPLTSTPPSEESP